MFEEEIYDLHVACIGCGLQRAVVFSAYFGHFHVAIVGCINIGAILEQRSNNHYVTLVGCQLQCSESAVIYVGIGTTFEKKAHPVSVAPVGTPTQRLQESSILLEGVESIVLTASEL
jgi:hypothetical protein